MFSPKMPHHCGYQAVLHLAVARVSISQVKTLTSRIAQHVINGFVSDDFMAGTRVKDVVAETEMCLGTCAAAVRLSVGLHP